MQLKRDTEFALRILHCLHSEGAIGRDEANQGVLLSEIALDSGISRIIVIRICEILKDNGLVYIHRSTEEKEFRCSMDAPAKHSLLEVIEVMEGGGNLFAVFERKSHMYRKCKKQISELQKKIARVLSGTSLESFFSSYNPKRRS